MPIDRYQNSTNYFHPQESNLLNVHKAMEYDGQGRPVLRTTINTSTVEITGPINILSTVTVSSTPENPVHVHLTEIGTFGTLTNFVPVQGTVTATQGTSPWLITGTVSLSSASLSALENISVQNNVSATITGSVLVSNFTSTVHVDNIPTAITVTNFTSTVQVSNNITATITSLPAITGTATVYQGTIPWTVTGTVTVSNFTSTVQVSNFTSTVSVSSLPAITGTVTVSNFTSTVHVDNIPTAITVTNFTSTVHVDNIPTAITVTNFTSTVHVSNTVSVSQYTIPWVVTGTVALDTNTLNALENISVQNNVTATITGLPAITGTIITSAFPDSAISAFEELLSAPITPLIQSDANYGLDPDVWRQTNINGGSVSIADTGLWTLNCSTQTNSYSRLYTSRYAKYQPGQGMMARWTAAYTTTTGTNRSAQGVANCVQVAGPIDREDGYAIGFSGSTSTSTSAVIGIQHRRAGKVEIRTITINTPPSGAQTATITLNSVPYTVSLSATADTNYTASQIMKALSTTTAATYWNIDACSSVLTFTYYSPGPKAGTYSFSSTGTGVLCTATVTQLVAGVNQIDTWYYQNQWDNQTVDFDPAKLNVYAMDMRWLGAGAVRFFVENPSTGKMTLLHTLRWTQNQTGVYPHINKPNLRIAYRIGSITNQAPARTAALSGASIFLAIQGLYNQSSMSQGWYNIDSTTRNKDIVWHLITIQNPYQRSSALNKSQLVMQDLTVAAQGNDPAVIYIVKNVQATNDLLLFNLVPGHGNPYWFAQYSITSTFTALGSENINNVQTLGINGSSQFDLMKYNLTLAPGDTFSVFISSSNAINRTSVGVTWRVD